jgi:prepilin-type N-terminal cleavage/methylation domain
MSPQVIRGRRFGARRGFTLIELLTTIAIIGILAALILAGLAGARASSERANCISNLRQIGVLASLWSVDNRGFVLPHEVRPANQPVEDSKDWWPQLLAPYVGTKYSHSNNTGTLRELACPTGMRALGLMTTSLGWNPTYAMFGSQKNVKTLAIRNPGSKVYIGDSPWSGNRLDWHGSAARPVSFSDTDVKDARGIIFRHRNKVNFLFHDGHVGTYAQSDLPLPPAHAATSHEYRSMFEWTY